MSQHSGELDHGRAPPPPPTPPPPPVSPAFAAVKIAVLSVAVLLLASLAVRLGTALSAASAWLFFLPAALVGYLFADFVSGTAHWFCDTFFNEETPLLGPRLILPFRDHHRHPKAITRYGFLEQDGSNYFVLIPPLYIAWRVGGPTAGDALSVFGHSFLLTFALGSIGTNLFHKWAHVRDVAPAVRWLQRRNLILSPRAHQMHHSDYAHAYCVTSGWMNRLLDPIDFFGRVERLIRSLQRRASHFTRPRRGRRPLSNGAGIHDE